jgi:adenylylsulfate reductase, subunit B
MPPIIHEDQCNACGVCADICPTDVFGPTGKKTVPTVRFPEECWHCNACVLDCALDAITLRIPLPAMMLYKPAASKTGKRPVTGAY